MADDQVYLDTYVVQQDMRIRLPKAIISNLSVQKGVTKFDIYMDVKSKALILRPNHDMSESERLDG